MVKNTPKSTDHMEAEKTTSLEEISSGLQSQVLADAESKKTEEINSIRKSTLTKREIMEQLSRERFPWDE